MKTIDWLSGKEINLCKKQSLKFGSLDERNVVSPYVAPMRLIIEGFGCLY